MRALAYLALAVLLLYGLHRLALLLEGRGWIYYRTRRPSGSALGNAFLEVQSMLEPEKRVLLEARREEAVEEAESGEPPETGPADEPPATGGAT